MLVPAFVTLGCAVDNEYIAKLPLFEARSDKIPGLMSPLERKEAIREKGKKGKKASEADKEMIVAQLMVEYRTSPDRNMRRESVDAMAKIPYSKRDQYMKEILNDEDSFVRISALEALGAMNTLSQEELVAIFIEHLKRDPDKDVRLTSVRLLGQSFPWQSPKSAISPELRNTVLAALGDALYDKISAVRYESMQSLHRVAGKDFGNDINRWIQYVQYVKGETSDAPRERSFAEKLPRIQLPMLK